MGKRKKIIIPIILLSILIVLIIIAIMFFNPKDTKEDNVKPSELSTLIIYKSEVTGNVITYDRLQYEGTDGPTYTYNCRTKDCKVIGGSDKLAIISDDVIHTYDLETKEDICLNIKGEYNTVEILRDEDLDKTYGYVFSLEDKDEYNADRYQGSLYYSLEDGKVYLKNQYDYINVGDSRDSIKYGLLVGIKTVRDDEVEDVYHEIPYLVDYKTSDVKIKGLQNGSFYIDDNFIYVWDAGDTSDLYLYNHKYEKIVDKMISEYVTDDETIYVNEKTKITRYDKNGKVLKELTGYNNISVLTMQDDDIYFVDELSNQLNVYDVTGEKIYELAMKSNWEFHPVLSGYYKTDDKEGIFLVVEDTSVEYGTMGSALEYWYNPKTKKSGVIKTEGIGGYAKPVLYLYPTNKTNVTVAFENNKLLTTTYPKYLNKWRVTAYPNGSLYDKNNNYYYALYWEENSNKEVDFKEGFYVTKDNAISFLEEKLTIIGLNNRERNEFIMYWLPILEKNEKNLVYFELTEERQSGNKLIINPMPDSLLRVSIHVKKVEEQDEIKVQELETFERKGFVAVEWGGKLYN